MFRSDAIDGDTWGQLRSTRWSPPPAAASDQPRRKTYVSALEQAEQLFRASAAVGPATRPLLLFYGLSQAGRAIAAAAASAEEWELNGHGISQKGTLRADLPDIRVTSTAEATSSFVRLSEILHSPLWGGASLSLNALWDSLPENRLSPLRDDGTQRRTPLYVDHLCQHDELHPLANAPVHFFPPHVVQSRRPGRALAKYLQSFPEATTHHSYLRVGPDLDADPRFSPDADGWGELIMNWKLPNGQAGDFSDRAQYLLSLTRPYAGSAYFFPALGSNRTSLHPLMSWWAVLHTLSMLARYHPAEWASHIDVDASSYAVPIERLLKEAITTVPRLIIETIEQVGGTSI
ncbi:hypothetical protein ADL21_11245 [Streptomyces albus subsp. albus]|nr:hypothetical protein ADL21_11245 [Streptomyces albus subsp. albus]